MIGALPRLSRRGARLLAAAALLAAAMPARAAGQVCGTPDLPGDDPTPISNVGSSSVTLAWTTNSNPAPPSTVYLVKTFTQTGPAPFFSNPPCSYAPSEDSAFLVSSQTTTNLSIVVPNLSGETNYYFYVYALDALGNQSSPLFLSATTGTSEPPFAFSETHRPGVWTNVRTIVLRAASSNYYRWIYLDGDPSTVLSYGVGTVWNGLPLPLALTSEGTSYFHASGYNPLNNEIGQADIGPFLLDTVPPDVAAVVGQSSATDATPIVSAVATSASNPRFKWAAPASLSPVAGYSYSIAPNPGVPPGNVVLTTDTFVDYAPPAYGTYIVNVKALDEAGNWGAVASFTYIYVKYVPAASSFTPKGNVFNPKLGQSLTLDYALSQAGRVKAKVYTPQGALVKSLVDEEDAAGVHAAAWNGRNESGQTVASGIYLLVIEAPGYKKTHKVAIVK